MKSWWMLKNSRGRPDALLTFAAWGTIAVLVKVLLNGASLALAGKTIGFGTIDALLAGAVLVPTLGAYTTKRVKGAKDEPGSPPAAGFADWRLCLALLAALGLLCLGIWDPWGWGLVDAGFLLGAGCWALAALAMSDPEGRGALVAELASIVGSVILFVSLVAAAWLSGRALPWWGSIALAVVLAGWAAWAKRIWIAERVRALWRTVRNEQPQEVSAQVSDPAPPVTTTVTPAGATTVTAPPAGGAA